MGLIHLQKIKKESSIQQKFNKNIEMQCATFIIFGKTFYTT